VAKALHDIRCEVARQGEYWRCNSENDMNTEKEQSIDIEAFLQDQNAYLRETYGHLSATHTERVYSRMVKLTEEVGELADALLTQAGEQRVQKTAKCDAGGIKKEVADVLIATCLLSLAMDIDPLEAMREKAKIIIARRDT
jgi:NTP pyrophosphatase (non-canonical NTP hydrolase)